MIDWKTRVQPYRAKYSLRHSALLLALYIAITVVNWVVPSGGISSWSTGFNVGVWLAITFVVAGRTLAVYQELRGQRKAAATPDLSNPTLTKD